MKRTTSNILFHWLPYIFIAIGLGAGLYVNAQADERWHNERDDRIASDCQAIKENTILIRKVIEQSFDDPIVIPVPEQADAVVREVIEGVNERAAAASDGRRAALLALVPDVEPCAARSGYPL